MSRSIDAAAGTRRAARWEFAPYALLRTAGVSITVVDELRFDRCAAHLDRYTAHQEELLREREALSAALHAEVREHREDADVRSLLIELRRQLYALKRPAPKALESARQVLSQAARGQVDAYLLALEEGEALRSGFAAVLEVEHQQKRAWLKEMIRAHEDFRAALDVANPSVSDRLESYLQSSAGSSPRKVLEESLVTYVLRAATKTSPLGRFTWTSVVPWPPSPGERLSVELDPTSLRSSVELHRSACRILQERILTHEQIGPRIRYRLNPDLQQRDEHALLITRRRTDRVTERYLRLPLRGSHRALIDFVERRGAISLLDLAEAVRGQSPISQVLPQLGKLVESGLLVPDLATGDDQTDPIGHLAEALRAAGLSISLLCAEHLEAVRDGLSAHPALSPSERAAARVRVRRSIESALGLLAPDEPPALPPNLIYENAVASVRRCAAPAALSSPPAGNADIVAELALFLQESAELQLGDLESFVHRYGVGGVCEDVCAFFLEPPPPRTPTPQVERYLLDMRARCERFAAQQQAFFQELLEQVTRRGQEQEVCLDPAWVEERLRPSPFRANCALILMLQAVPRENAYVLNAVFPGQGALFSRFAPQLATEDAGAASLRSLARVHERLARPGTPAQLVLASNYAVGSFAPLTAEALYVPGAAPPVRKEGELRFKDVRLYHDVSRHRLRWSDRAGRPLTPLHLGAVALPLLPPVSQRVARLDPGVVLRRSLATTLESLSGPAPGPVRVWPRLRLNQFIVSRRTWVIHRWDEIARRKGETELDHWLRVRKWAQESGVPRRFFLYPPSLHSPQPAPSGPGPSGEQGWEILNKPQFIDLDNAHLVRTLEKLSRRIPLPCSLQELLPAPEDAVATMNGHPHTMELCLEVLSSPGA